MKTIKFLTLLLLFTGIFTFTSCDDDAPAPIVNTHDDAYGDVLLKKVMTPDGIRYKEVFFAGGTDIVVEGSKVVSPDGTEYPLTEYWAGEGKLRNMDAAMSMLAYSGDYTFSLMFNDGYRKTIIDTLEEVEIALPTPFMVEFTEAETLAESYYTITWSIVENADLYCVKITELDMLGSKPIFKKSQIATSENSIKIYIDGGTGWMRPTDQLVSGTEYWFAVAAKKVETGAEVSGASPDFQTSACVKTKIMY